MVANHLISVIVPIYKVEAYLDRCVESLINQTYKNLEIILVDDGSPDKCPEMCDEWAARDARIKVIHKQNGGLSDARNAGLGAATGKYISFVDSDDMVDRNFIFTLFDAVSKTGAEISACDVISFYDEGELSTIDNPDIKVEEFTPEQALFQLINGVGFRAVAWNKLYKADLLLNEGFEFGKLHEDEFFSYRIYDKCSKLAYINLPLYQYRQRDGSIMAVLSEKHLDALEAGLRRLEFLKDKYVGLYNNDKITFCIGCLNFYQLAISHQLGNAQAAKKKIKWYRKQVKFSLQNFLAYNFKQKFYILASMSTFIEPISKLRNLRGER